MRVRLMSCLIVVASICAGSRLAAGPEIETPVKLLPGVRSPLADAAHLGEPGRLCGDHLERALAETLHQTLGERRTDARDEPRAQVAGDTGRGLGRHGREALDHEALAVARV